MSARITPPTEDALQQAVTLLRAGACVAMPTETVYGLAADATNPDAVARVFEIKGRPSFNPLISHVASLEEAAAYAVLHAQARALADAFWPGPLTIVAESAADTPICAAARARLSTVALRVPAHPAAQALLSAFGGPLVAPSANPSGRLSPTAAQHVAEDLGDQIQLILDGGPCERGVESTVIDVRGDTPVLLRPGSLTETAIEAVWPGLKRANDTPNAPRSPGQTLRHYSPRQALRLNATEATSDESYLGFGPGPATLNLSPTSDLAEAAANLFAMLRELDAHERPIAVAPIPGTGLGAAINDRLTRAAKSQ